MFREMRRMKQQVSREDCVKVLKDARRAVLAVNGDDGYPYAMTMDFVYDEERDRIYLHGALAGYRYDCLQRSDKVCFTVCGDDYKNEGDWFFQLDSVIVYGRCIQVADRELKLKEATALGQKYFPTADILEDELQRNFDRMTVYEITIEHMTGKHIREK